MAIESDIGRVNRIEAASERNPFVPNGTALFILTHYPKGKERSSRFFVRLKERTPATMLRIYSFGPSGAGRMQTPSGTTIFPPPAPVDVVKGISYELVRVRPVDSTQSTKLARFGRYFQLDEREAPYPPPVPPCTVKFVTEWTPDDGSDQTKSEETSAATYLGPGQTLWTTALDSEWIFEVDRPGRLGIVYVLTSPSDWILLGHAVHFVDDPTAPWGAELLPAQFYKDRQRRNFSERSIVRRHRKSECLVDH